MSCIVVHMPLMKCVPCKIRLHRVAGPADPLGDLCPECASRLEPVGALAEVVGFRLIDRRDDGVVSSLAAEAVAMPRPETTA
jgi:hypothetical protein